MGKILMYSTSELFGDRVTGGLKRFLELYYGLKSKEYKVDLFSADDQHTLKINDIRGSSLNITNIRKGSLFPSEVVIMLKNIKIIKKIKKRKYETVIVFDVPTALSLTLAGVKNIQLFVRQDLIEYKSISLRNRTNNKFFIFCYLRLLKLTELVCILKSEKVIVQCEYDLNELIIRHSFFNSIIKRKAYIQINNVNPSWIINDSIKTIDNKITNDKKSNVEIAFIGDFSNSRKGHELFIESIKSLLDKGYNINVIIIGDGDSLNYYSKICSEYKHIKFLGRVKNPIKLIKSSDLVVVPSLADSCPNTVMESLYNEIPVIGANTGGIPEILIDSEQLFELTRESLENKIIEMLNSSIRAKVGENQKKRKKDLTFDWTEKVIKIIEH